MKYIKTLPFYSKLDDDYLEVALWEKEQDDYFCEFQNDPNEHCDDVGIAYGTSDEHDPKFCPLHFYTRATSGDGLTDYKLVHESELPKEVK